MHQNTHHFFSTMSKKRERSNGGTLERKLPAEDTVKKIIAVTHNDSPEEMQVVLDYGNVWVSELTRARVYADVSHAASCFKEDARGKRANLPVTIVASHPFFWNILTSEDVAFLEQNQNLMSKTRITSKPAHDVTNDHLPGRHRHHHHRSSYTIIVTMPMQHESFVGLFDSDLLLRCLVEFDQRTRRAVCSGMGHVSALHISSSKMYKLVDNSGDKGSGIIIGARSVGLELLPSLTKLHTSLHDVVHHLGNQTQVILSAFVCVYLWTLGWLFAGWRHVPSDMCHGPDITVLSSAMPTPSVDTPIPLLTSFLTWFYGYRNGILYMSFSDLSRKSAIHVSAGAASRDFEERGLREMRVPHMATELRDSGVITSMFAFVVWLVRIVGYAASFAFTRSSRGSVLIGWTLLLFWVGIDFALTLHILSSRFYVSRYASPSAPFLVRWITRIILCPVFMFYNCASPFLYLVIRGKAKTITSAE